MAIRKGTYVKLCYNGKEVNISFQKGKKKKEDSIKMGYFGCLLSPLVSGFNSETSGPGQMLPRMGRARQPWIQGPAVQPTLE